MKRLTLLVALLIITSGCTIKYSLSNASLPPDIKTATIIYFPNMATMVSPLLTTEFNDALNQKIQRETRLTIVREGGDVVFEGQIIDYQSVPMAISAEERSLTNRLTVAVRVKFTNNKHSGSFEKTFSAYADYPSEQMLNTIEAGIIPEIVKKLTEDIFNEAFSNW